jgi:hypothetical protein
MIYTEATLKADLKRLNVKAWPAWVNPTIRNDLLARYPGIGIRDSLDETAAYCWRAYQSARQAVGDQVIGRIYHLRPGALNMYEKVGQMVGDETLFDRGTHGNTLKMDKWTMAVNDSWVLGGVHRQANFRLVSPRVMENLWNADGYFVVTARELLGLLHFGYELAQVGPWQVLICRNKSKAMNASLLEYDRIVKTGETVGQAEKLAQTEDSNARAARQVEDWKNRKFGAISTPAAVGG